MRLLRRIKRKAKVPVTPAPETAVVLGRACCPPSWYSQRTEPFLVWGRAGRLTLGQASRSPVPGWLARASAEDALDGLGRG